MAKKRKKLNLALQGGGAHGAFTWGVLDKLLEEKLFTIEAISGTSAGSMNAVICAQGYMEGEDEGARDALYEFWHAMSEYGKKYNVCPSLPADFLLQPYLKNPLSYYMLMNMVGVISPYQFNPSNFNPIGQVLDNMVDFEKLNKESPIKLFICATNVKTGKIRIFRTGNLTTKQFLASACLPKLFQSVDVDGEYYWDGGYIGDPAIFPLIYQTEGSDIAIIHIVPLIRDTIPTETIEIESRLREIAFNTALMREIRAIAFVTRLIEDHWIKEEHKDRLRKINLHCLRADDVMEKLTSSSILSPEWSFLTKLRDLGRKRAEIWLKDNYDAIGTKSTIDFTEWL